MSESSKDLFRRFVEECFNTGKLELVDEFVVEDYLDHNALPGVPAGREGERAQVALTHTAFTDPRLVIHDMISEGDRLVVRSSFEGVHTGEFFGMAPTGRSFATQTIDIFRVADGKLVEHWGLLDTAALMQQLTG